MGDPPAGHRKGVLVTVSLNFLGNVTAVDLVTENPESRACAWDFPQEY